jgi:hypothetical protein
VTSHSIKGWCAAFAVLTGSCAGGPTPIVIHDSPLLTVAVVVDPRSDTRHDHPFTLTSEAMTAVLSGVHIEDRDTITGIGLLGSQHGKAAFSVGEIATLAPHLVEALRKASPKDLATFYMIVNDGNGRKSVTSGGLFVDPKRRLHVMLANCRSVASGGQDYTMAMELDTRDEPLLPLSPQRFRVSFHPQEAWVRTDTGADKPGFQAYRSVYGDPAKVVVIDLDRLLARETLPTPH